MHHHTHVLPGLREDFSNLAQLWKRVLTSLRSLDWNIGAGALGTYRTDFIGSQPRVLRGMTQKGEDHT